MHGCFSHVWLFATLWTVALQAPLSMRFCRQEYWRGLLCPPPGDLHDPGIEPMFLMFPELAGGLFITSTTWEAYIHVYMYHFTSPRRNSLNISCKRVLLAKKKKKPSFFIWECFYLEDNLLDKKKKIYRLVFWFSFSKLNIFSTSLLLEWVLMENVI